MIRVDGLNKSFNGIQAVQGITFSAEDGKVTALLGPNGAGKSTTLRILATVLAADSGTAYVDAHEVASNPMAVRSQIGVLPHASGLYNRLTTRENITYFGELHGIPRADLQSRVEELIEDGALTNVTVIPAAGEFKREEGQRRFYIEGLGIGVRDVDLALTFRNLHNFTEQGRRDLNQEVFDALKSGGLYGVVDHTRRHMQSDYDENWRRMDPVQMIKEIEAAGFEFVDYSDLHYRPDDTLEYEVGRKSVSGNTDRFALLFRKP